MAISLCNLIEIDCPPEVLFDYVTQPWRWHEWHPNSRSATESKIPLQVGDGFDEVIQLRPFAPLLPVTLLRYPSYRVMESRRAGHWAVRGEMKDAWVQIQYDFEPIATGTRFTRTLEYHVTGLMRLAMLFLVPYMRRMSVVALGNLKQKIEAPPA